MRHLTLVSLVVLVGTEVLGVAIAGGWALAGLFGLGRTVEIGLMAVFSAFGLYLLVRFARMAAPVDAAELRRSGVGSAAASSAGSATPGAKAS